MGILPCLSLLDDEFLSPFFSFFSPSLFEQWRELVKEEEGGEEREGGEEEKKVEGGEKKGKKKKQGRGGRRKRGWRERMVKGYQLGRGGVYVCLFVFLVFLSAPPVKEMFGPSPWLKYYDDYFFVTSQGVFGFVTVFLFSFLFLFLFQFNLFLYYFILFFFFNSSLQNILKDSSTKKELSSLSQ